MPDYRRIDNGRKVSATNPARGIWYSAGCGYWTDDWNKVRGHGPGHQIPCCPSCGSVGYQGAWEEWFADATAYQNENHPRYIEFLFLRKETCGGKGYNFLEGYEAWLKELPSTS